MATQTTNYGLTKPSYNETADIGVINSNMDIIDAKMKAIENKAGSGGGGGNTDTYGHVKVGSVTIDASGDDTIELVAGSNVTLTPDTTSKSVTISASGGGGGGTSDYLQLSNKPKINGIELVDNTTTEDLGIVVPQYTSELENDSGFITNEADPTVPAWAKEPTKPTYTAEEVGALPSNTPIPDPTSVVIDRFVSVGTHIADISVNGEKTELYAPTGGGGTPVTVDSELSTTSENPVQNKVITQALNGKGTYSKPTGGIPKTDLASEVQTSLGKADTALQEHQDISGKADKADLTALSNTISDAWKASTTYAVGQYCIYNNSLWKCLVQNKGQTPKTGTYWTKVNVANEITSVNNSLGGFSFKTTSGKKQVSTDGGNTWSNFSGGAELVWTNPAPTQAFSPQTIELDLSNYNAVIIELRAVTSNAGKNKNIVLKSDTFPLVIAAGRTDLSVNGGRIITSISDTEIVFGYGVYTNLTNRTDMGIPLNIYGTNMEFD